MARAQVGPPPDCWSHFSRVALVKNRSSIGLVALALTASAAALLVWAWFWDALVDDRPQLSLSVSKPAASAISAAAGAELRT